MKQKIRKMGELKRGFRASEKTEVVAEVAIFIAIVMVNAGL